MAAMGQIPPFEHSSNVGNSRSTDAVWEMSGEGQHLGSANPIYPTREH